MATTLAVHDVDDLRQENAALDTAVTKLEKKIEEKLEVARCPFSTFETQWYTWTAELPREMAAAAAVYALNQEPELRCGSDCEHLFERLRFYWFGPDQQTSHSGSGGSERSEALSDFESKLICAAQEDRQNASPSESAESGPFNKLFAWRACGAIRIIANILFQLQDEQATSQCVETLYLYAWTNIKKANPKLAYGPYVNAPARQRALDYLSKIAAQKQTQKQPPIAQAAGPPPINQSPLALVEGLEQCDRWLAHVLACDMKPHYRFAFFLIRFLEHKPADVVTHHWGTNFNDLMTACKQEYALQSGVPLDHLDPIFAQCQLDEADRAKCFASFATQGRTPAESISDWWRAARIKLGGNDGGVE